MSYKGAIAISVGTSARPEWFTKAQGGKRRGDSWALVFGHAWRNPAIRPDGTCIPTLSDAEVAASRVKEESVFEDKEWTAFSAMFGDIYGPVPATVAKP